MDLHAFFTASVLVQVHAGAALAAFVLGAAQFLGPRGQTTHKVMGWSFLAMMGVAAGTAVFIRSAPHGGMSWIHALIPVTLIGMVAGVLHARAGRVRQHGIAMAALFLGALVVAGAFTLSPGRLMHAVVFPAG